MKNRNYFFILLLMVTAVFAGCEKTELQTEAAESQKTRNYQVFDSHTEFEQALENVGNNKSEDNFVSLYDVFEIASYTSTTDERIAIVEKYKDVLFLDADGIVEMKISDPALAKVLNVNGVVQIGDSLCAFTDNSVKIMFGENHDEELLLSAIENDSENGISINKNNKNTNKAYWNGEVFYSESGRNFKAKWEKWAQYEPIIKSNVGGQIRHYEKNSWGIWMPSDTQLKIWVSWDYILWSHDGSIIVYDDDEIFVTKTGWDIYERRWVAVGYTPNPVVGLGVKFVTRGRTFER